MRLTEIQLRQFRQFDAGISIDGLAPGINVFHGPNESGKSTLVQAIRAAFFERHSSSTLSALQPWSDSAAAPEVSLKFDFNGRRYHLVKRFVRQKRCDLTVDGQNLNGDEAEQHLAQMMGFAMPPRGASRPEHWGIPGLLWVEQGSGHQLDASVAHASEHLQGILNDAMGQVASSDGDMILQKVEERLARLLTRATAAPTQDYRKAIETQQQLQSQLAALDTTIQNYRDQIDQLASLQADQDRDNAEQPWRALRQNELAAREQLAEVNAMRDQQKREKDALEVCSKTQTLLHQQLEGFQQQTLALRTRESEFARQRDVYQQLSSQTDALQQALRAASDAHDQVRELLRRSREAQQRRDKKDRLMQLTAEVARLREHRDQAVQTQRLLLEDGQRAEALRISPEALNQLRTLDTQLQSLQIRQQAVATRLQFKLAPGQVISLDDIPVTGQAEHLLLNEATLTIPGVGHLRIIPGGDDVAGLAREHDRLHEEWQASLHASAVTSLEQAQQRAADYHDMTAKIRQHQAVLKLHAPDGLAALEQRLDTLMAQRQAMQEDYDALVPGSESDPDADDVQTVQVNAQEAEHYLKVCENAQQEHLVATATAKAAMDAAERELQQAQATISDARRAQTEQQTLQRLHEERAQQAMLKQRIATLQARIDAVRPDILEQDITRYSQSAAQLQEANAERERKIRELKGRLQALGAQGLEEQRDALASQLAATDRRVDEFSRNAAALTLLHALLQQKRQALTRQLHAPLKQRLVHYLDVLFDTPTHRAQLTIGDDLMPASLTRQDAQAELRDLSFGAREQLGLISRLAYADLLKDAGRPTLIMLDDALVHSDVSRLGSMKRILFDAAARHQILLFTCHPDNWRDVGVTPRSIPDLKLSGIH